MKLKNFYDTEEEDIMIEIRRVPKEHIEEMARINQFSYGAMYEGSDEERERVTNTFTELSESDDVELYGAYKNGELAGVMNYYSYNFNFHGEMIKMAGIGALAVDLLHKKEKVAKELIQYSIDLSRERNTPLYTLYPFNTRFYRNFGFGYGNPVSVIKSPPANFRDYSNKHLLEYCTKDDLDDLFAFHDEVVRSTHGMAYKATLCKRRLLKMKNGRIIKAVLDGKIIGYLVYTVDSLKKAFDQESKMKVREMFYSDRAALMAFSSFFHSQSDQISYIELHTFDKSIHYILDDLYFGEEHKMLDLISHKYSDQSLGLLYLSLDHRELLDKIKDRTKYNLDFNISYPRKLEVDRIQSDPSKEESIKIKIKINEFSSWICGAATLEELYNHGRLETEKHDLLREIDNEFYFTSPKCYTTF